MSESIKDTDTKSTDNKNINIVGLDIFREKLIGNKTNEELAEIAKKNLFDGNSIQEDWIKGIVCAVTVMESEIWKEITSEKGEKFTSRQLFCKEFLKITISTYYKSARALRAYVAITADSNLVKPMCYYQLEPISSVKDPDKIREIWMKSSTSTGAPTNSAIAENVNSAPTAGIRRIPKGDVLRIFELIQEAQSCLTSDEPKKVASALHRATVLISEFISEKKILEIKQKLPHKSNKAKAKIDKQIEDTAASEKSPDSLGQRDENTNSAENSKEEPFSILKCISVQGSLLVVQLPNVVISEKYKADLIRMGFETCNDYKKSWRNFHDEAEAERIKSELSKMSA